MGRRLAIAACWLIAMQCSAQVHRCVGPDGKVEFSNAPCAVGSTGNQVRVVPNTLNTSGAREQALKEENARLRQQLDDQRYNQQRQVPQQPMGRTYPDLQAEKASSYECRMAQANYETAVASASRSKDPEGEARPAQLKMYAACGMREPDRTTVVVQPKRTSSVPARITHCNNVGCYSDTGQFFPRSTCRNVANMVHCN